MMAWLFNTLFGCSHRRTTFPFTPSRHSQLSSNGSRRKATYVVCLDCGQELDYNWKEMRLEGDASADVSHARVSLLSLVNRSAEGEFTKGR
jgi:hypothetical protein